MTRLARLLSFGLLSVAVLLTCAVAWTSANDRTNENATKEWLPVIEFQTRNGFKSDEDYAQYVQKTLRVGWRVRASMDYQNVKKGMMGTYYGTNAGSPPCLVIWDNDLRSTSSLLPNVPPNKASHAYWVYWHQVNVVGIKP